MMKKEGESLLEVAIFGAIIIMLLGVLISYGLRYNYQQKMMQQAFRKSLTHAVNQPGTSISNVVISDKHIPNPSDTFGVGSVTPMTGSAGGIARDYRLGETADTESELPRVAVNINGKEFSYTTAGFRDESNVPESSLGRYQVIYGGGNVWNTGDGECLGEESTSINPNTGEPEGTTCSQPSKNIRIIDSCAGEIIDYGSAVKQCRMIVDADACVKECSRDLSVDCSVCAQPMNVPWYCANYQETDTTSHTYNFPVLEKLFSFAGLKAMGLQQDYEQKSLTDNTLRKTEDASGITTTDNIDWKTQTKRKIITKPYGSTSAATNTEEVVSEVSQEKVDSRNSGW